MAGYLSPGAYFYAEEQEYLQAYEDVLERYKGRAALLTAGPPHPARLPVAPQAAARRGQVRCPRHEGTGMAPGSGGGNGRQRAVASAINENTVPAAPEGETRSPVLRSLFFSSEMRTR